MSVLNRLMPSRHSMSKISSAALNWRLRQLHALRKQLRLSQGQISLSSASNSAACVWLLHPASNRRLPYNSFVVMLSTAKGVLWLWAVVLSTMAKLAEGCSAKHHGQTGTDPAACRHVC